MESNQSVDNPMIASLKHEIRRARKPEEFEKMRKEVDDITVQHFRIASEWIQAKWESLFVTAARMYEFKLILFANHGTTHRVRYMALVRLNRLSPLLKDLVGVAHCTFSDDVKRSMVVELKRCVK